MHEAAFVLQSLTVSALQFIRAAHKVSSMELAFPQGFTHAKSPELCRGSSALRAARH